jgi:CheY-like chemotaxis protein
MRVQFLLIDDEAEKGWDVVLSAILKDQFGQDSILDCVSENDQVSAAITKFKHHLIFLDLRFGEKDHFEEDFKKLTGYQVLLQLRNPANLNFATPVIIFSASSKIWIVEDLLQAGADSYYIKESPLNIHDESFTKNNYLRFLNELKRLNELSARRSLVWDKIRIIKEKSVSTILNTTIRQRIVEKLHIGYGTLFRHITTFEKCNFFFTNEVIGFIVFWSILEEISKDFYLVDWRERPQNYSWKVRGSGKFFLEDNVVDEKGVPVGVIRIHTLSRKNQKFEFKERRPRRDEDNYNDFMRINTRQINLSDQISSLLNLRFNWDYNRIKDDFLDKLNGYRNSIDFIHGNAAQITTQTVLETFKEEASFSKCLEMLDFLVTLLE